MSCRAGSLSSLSEDSSDDDDDEMVSFELALSQSEPSSPSLVMSLSLSSSLDSTATYFVTGFCFLEELNDSFKWKEGRN